LISWIFVCFHFYSGKKFGITDFVHAGECETKSVSQIIIEMTGGGADYCFECVGMASLVHEAYASCRKVYFYLSKFA
jgi:S-(hydroxymethyl)glutathione dehydrogenase/alcohol dehydrogenase